MNIEISEGTYKRLLNEMSKDETCELVIRRLLDCAPASFSKKNMGAFAEQSDEGGFSDEEGYVNNNQTSPSGEEIVFKQWAIPNDMSQTKLHRFWINDMHYDNINWNKAVRIMLVILSNKGKNASLLDCPGLVVRDGKYNKVNNTYLPKIDKSVQGVSAMGAARIITYLANEHKMNAELIFSWRTHEDALHPGKKGKITVTNPE